MHVSGHACKGELKLIHSLTKPKYFMPVHGEYRHLVQHAMLAASLGMPEENVFIPELGNALEITRRSAHMTGGVPAGSLLIDGLGIGDVGNIVMRDRRLLSQDGLMVVCLTFDSKTGELVTGPDIISRLCICARIRPAYRGSQKGSAGLFIRLRALQAQRLGTGQKRAAHQAQGLPLHQNQAHAHDTAHFNRGIIIRSALLIIFRGGGI